MKKWPFFFFHLFSKASVFLATWNVQIFKTAVKTAELHSGLFVFLNAKLNDSSLHCPTARSVVTGTRQPAVYLCLKFLTIIIIHTPVRSVHIIHAVGNNNRGGVRMTEESGEGGAPVDLSLSARWSEAKFISACRCHRGRRETECSALNYYVVGNPRKRPRIKPKFLTYNIMCPLQHILICNLITIRIRLFSIFSPFIYTYVIQTKTFRL